MKRKTKTKRISVEHGEENYRRKRMPIYIDGWIEFM